MEAKIHKLNSLEEHLNNNIKGQDHVIEKICSVLNRGELGLAHPDRPKGSFLFVGPTGTGKTEVTQCFTEHLFGKSHLIRFDMSEFMNKSSLEKLIGGVGETGLLGKKLEDKTCGTLLFDEMEKADPQILDLFLQMLDAGRITLGDYSTISLKSFYIVFTSNIGSSEIRNMTRCPFATIERVVLNHVNDSLRPELVGRINEKIVFKSLSYDVQVAICQSMLEKEKARLKHLGFSLEVEASAVEYLISEGYHRSLGARPMREVIEKQLGDLVSERLLKFEGGSGRVVFDRDSIQLTLKKYENI